MAAAGFDLQQFVSLLLAAHPSQRRAVQRAVLAVALAKEDVALRDLLAGVPGLSSPSVLLEFDTPSGSRRFLAKLVRNRRFHLMFLGYHRGKPVWKEAAFCATLEQVAAKVLRRRPRSVRMAFMLPGDGQTHGRMVKRYSRQPADLAMFVADLTQKLGI